VTKKRLNIKEYPFRRGANSVANDVIIKTRLYIVPRILSRFFRVKIFLDQNLNRIERKTDTKFINVFLENKNENIFGQKNSRCSQIQLFFY
jgi:hypothetical protein